MADSSVLKLKKLRKLPQVDAALDGRDGKEGAAGEQGIAGFNPRIELQGTSIRIESSPDQFSAWVDLKGEVGSNGIDGIAGVQGKRGEIGNRGTPGNSGKQGKQGPKGNRGEEGSQGPKGVQGRDGTVGPQGPKGDSPNHQWTGSKLRFQTPTGKWGKWTDLRGPQGAGGNGVAGFNYLAASVTSRGADYTLTRDDYLVLIDATTASVTITLPTAGGFENRRYRVKKIDSGGNTVTLSGHSSETVDGESTQILSNQYDAIHVISDGAEWYIV